MPAWQSKASLAKQNMILEQSLARYESAAAGHPKGGKKGQGKLFMTNYNQGGVQQQQQQQQQKGWNAGGKGTYGLMVGNQRPRCRCCGLRSHALDTCWYTDQKCAICNCTGHLRPMCDNAQAKAEWQAMQKKNSAIQPAPSGKGGGQKGKKGS